MTISGVLCFAPNRPVLQGSERDVVGANGMNANLLLFCTEGLFGYQSVKIRQNLAIVRTYLFHQHVKMFITFAATSISVDPICPQPCLASLIVFFWAETLAH